MIFVKSQPFLSACKKIDKGLARLSGKDARPPPCQKHIANVGKKVKFIFSFLVLLR